MKINPEVIKNRCQEIADSVARLERIGQGGREQFLLKEFSRLMAALV